MNILTIADWDCADEIYLCLVALC